MIKADKTPHLYAFIHDVTRFALRCYGFSHVTTGLGTWRTHYLVALLPPSLFFRFDVLVTVHLYDPL